MASSIIVLVVSLGIILVSAELFTNGVEWLGKRLNLSEGAVGSILAAVGTALPETLVPIIAIMFGVGETAKEIGVGAILGAPFMLGTLALFVTGTAVIVFSLLRRRGTEMKIERTVMLRDLGFFLVVYSVAILAAFLDTHSQKLTVSVILILAYVFYAYNTIRSGRGIGESELNPLIFARGNYFPGLRRILAQVFVALFGIVIGAKIFVGGIENLAEMWQLPAFILSIIITPIATELPEKFNSVIWVSQRKDTLALGNITGAMVFQSSIIPAIGIWLTPWVLTKAALTSAILVLISAALIFFHVLFKRHLSAFVLLSGGFFYLLFLFLVLTGIVS